MSLVCCWVIVCDGALVKHFDDTCFCRTSFALNLCSSLDKTDSNAPTNFERKEGDAHSAHQLSASSPSPAAPSQAAARSSTIDGAKIILGGRLGGGNFGEAWLASYSGADVVVKRIKAQLPEDQKASAWLID